MNREEKELDKITMEIISELGSETPSSGFTGKVMERIENSYNPVIKAIPLISKLGWIIITTVLLTVYVAVFIWGAVPEKTTQQNLLLEKLLSGFNAFFYNLFQIIISNPVIIISILIFIFLILVDNLAGKKIWK